MGAVLAAGAVFAYAFAEPLAQEKGVWSGDDIRALGMAFNGRKVLDMGEALVFEPGRMNRLAFTPSGRAAENAPLRVIVTRRTPEGREHVETQMIPVAGTGSFLLGPMTAPPLYEFETGEVYRRGYGLEIVVTPRDGGEPIFRRGYQQGLADTPVAWRWSSRRDMRAGSERLLVGDAVRVRYNPLYGVEQAVDLRLSEQVLSNQDDVRVRMRLNAPALVERLRGRLLVRNEHGALLTDIQVELTDAEFSSSLDVAAWPEGNYRIAFYPELDGRLWEEGPAVTYRRRSVDGHRVRLSARAPWSLERDGAREEVEITDFSHVFAAWSANGERGEWVLEESGAARLLSHPAVPGKDPLVLRPRLKGMYAVFASGFHGGCLLQIGEDDLVRPLHETREGVFIAATDLADAAIRVYPFELNPSSEARAVRSGLARLRLVPVTAASLATFRQQTRHPPVPLHAITDWADILHRPIRIDADQFDLLVGAQTEIGLRTVAWSIGRSWLEYHTKLPNRDLFPVVPLEEAARTNPRAMAYEGRILFINRLTCPLEAVLSGRPRTGAEIWPWLAMNRHYGERAHGGMFASKWFVANPQWHRWRKNAKGPDRGEVSYFFPEVRQERVEILLEAAEKGADGILVGTTRQVPMLLYHPDMVARYREKTGIDPQQIDAADGQTYEDWIRWRADHFTEVLRMLRRRLADIEGRQGRRIPVGVRIPSAGLFYNLAQGLDVEQWLHEGIVDRLYLNPLEERGGRGSHDVTPYLALGREHEVEIIGGVGASGRFNTGGLRRALGLLEAGVDGLENYATEYLTPMNSMRWMMPLLGHPDRLRDVLANSNLDACDPVTGSSAMAGYDNHSRWQLQGYSVYGKGANSL